MEEGALCNREAIATEKATLSGSRSDLFHPLRRTQSPRVLPLGREVATREAEAPPLSLESGKPGWGLEFAVSHPWQARGSCGMSGEHTLRSTALGLAEVSLLGPGLAVHAQESV